MLPWQDVLPENGEALIARAPKWCPFCFDEQAKSIGYVYQPLSWTLELYRCCPRHASPLTDVCPRCLKTQPFVPAVPDIGHCAHCGACLLSREVRIFRGETDEFDVQREIE